MSLNADLVGLIRSGYAGTHLIETERLKPFLKALDQGERGVVLAWQQAVERRA